MAGEPVAEPPRPAPDELTKFFWDGCNQQRLMILRCTGCGYYIHWPRPVCPKCLSTDLGPSEVSGRATLYAHTVSHQAFHPFFADKLPLLIATVALVEQEHLHMLTNLVDCAEDDLVMGMSLAVTFREIAADLVLPLFAPAV